MRRHSGAVALLGVSVLFIVPMLALVIAPLREPGLAPPRGIELIPDRISFQSFRDAFQAVPLGRSILNSALVALFAVPLTLLTSSAGALAITLASPRLRRFLVVLLLSTAMLPVTAVWIPRFALFHSLGLIGTYVPLIAPALMGASPLFVLLYYLALRRLPPELFEASRMEGAGPIRIWWKVALPLVHPTTTAIGLLTLVAFWSNFIDPLLYLRKESDLTAPVMLHHLELLGPTNWPVFLAGALVVTLPVVGAFLIAQRFLWSSERGSGWLGR